MLSNEDLISFWYAKWKDMSKRAKLNYLYYRLDQLEAKMRTANAPPCPKQRCPHHCPPPAP